ncbi:helix-turn-helix domain-containing protein [Actinotignum urinale]|uniref:helix-turn-helix domain-containing protein n=1 Tax=Actinotignum urinale TaxID=190146 RepID=UPI000C802A96|nr:helix-turn-helix domain-containing protein [Actinotignum urinale]WIK58871.1 helix-turn-helix domain-containing protein [Actinotignum urinale]
MDYTATIHIETTMDVDDILEILTPYHPALGGTKGGCATTITFPADNFSQALTTAEAIGAKIGTPYAMDIAPTALLDSQPENQAMPELLSVSQTAEMLGITVQGVHDRIQRGKLGGVKVGSQWVIPLYSVLNNLVT